MQELVDRGSGSATSSDAGTSEFSHCVEILRELWPSSTDGESSTYSSCGDSVSGAPSQPGNSGRLGRFEIRGTLGHGGFGVVLLAYDATLAREIALKIPRPELLVAGGMRERFLREAQAVAMLDHPGIVPVFDAGEMGLVWYIVEGYVKGPSLAAWLRERGTPLPSKLAASIVLALTESVDHAHSRGILHRDLKPSNVLLEPCDRAESNEFPFVPKLTDFGLSKPIETVDDQTSGRVLIGTPRYMAPEQAANRYKEIGIATDVYGLGAILHELLTAEPPFVAESNAAVLHRIQHDELSPARLRARGVPRDLETICLKCLEKEPSRRYQSARELSDDLRHFLAGEPVAARPIGAAARWIRWCRRNRAVATLAATVLLALAGGTAVSTYYALAAGARAREAERALEQARKAVDDSFTVISEQRLLNEPGMEPLRRDLLKTALKYYQDFARTHAGDPTLQSELAEAHLRAAGIHAAIGEHSQAEPLFRKAIELRESLARENSASTDRRRELGDAYASIATWQGINRRTAETEHLFFKAIRVREQLAREYPTVATYQRDLAASYHGLADLYRITRGRAEAELMLVRGTEIREKLAHEHPTVASYQNDLGLSYHTLAVSHSDAGRRDEAEKFFRKAIAIRESLARENPVGNRKRELAQSYKLLAYLLTSTPRHAEAEDLFRKAIQIHEKLAQASPTVVRFRRDLADAFSRFANLEAVLAHNADAEASYRRAIEIQQQLIDEIPMIATYQAQLADYCWSLAALLRKTGKIDEAHLWYDKTVKAHEVLARSEPANANYRYLLGCRYLYGADDVVARAWNLDAEASYRRAIDIFEKVVVENPSSSDSAEQLATAYAGLAVFLADSGRADATIQEYRNAIKQWSAHQDQPDRGRKRQPALSLLHARLAMQMALAGIDWERVGEEAKEAIALAPDSMIVHALAGDAAGVAGRWLEAASFYTRASELSERHLSIMMKAARLLVAAGDLPGHRAMCAQIMDSHGPTATPRQGSLIAMTCLLADHALGDMAPVLELAQRSASSEPHNPVMMAVMGGAMYRAGQVQDAIEVLTKALPLHEEPIRLELDHHEEFRVSQLLAARFLASAYRELGETQKKAPMLTEIDRQIAEMERLDIVRSSRGAAPWSFRLAVELARSELGEPDTSSEQ